MTVSKMMLLALVAAAALLQFASSSIYPVENQYWVPPFQHAEKMFATNRGPVLSRTGNSSVTFDVRGVNLTADMNGWRLVVFLYHVDNYDIFETVADKIELLACSQETGMKFDGMSSVQKFTFPVTNESVHAIVNYQVDQSGWTDSQIFVCADESDSPELLSFSGSMEIRNPYGLLPAPLYGMLPFSGFLSIGYAVLDVFFAFLLCRHRQQIIQLHYGIFFVLLMGTVAASVWFYAFYRMNKTGEPAAVRTLARIILLVVCLGYGIVRNTLSRTEVVVVSLLSIAYFTSGVGDEVTRGTSSGAEFRQKPTLWSFAQLICNLVFIMWIHFSLERILKQLKDQKQFAKHGMYKSLAWALASFILFFTILTVVAVCSRFGVFEWDVEWEWMQLVAWPVLNFTVSAAMCLIWRPTKNSSQFAFSMQLPMTDDGTGLEMTTRESSSDDDVEVESDDDDVHVKKHEAVRTSSNSDSDDADEGV
uniref:GOST seven transmembrane domain-containing protein n=1 Tax=Globisporangium ultimum (strain ATCC 200006 / CBS 805.95 / DAOM BR144) TaxID=431595 RepID=K3WZP9_GLOUD